MTAGQRDIFYLSAPSRQLAESSPYYEQLKKRDLEVLFCYESYDELVLMQLQQFDKKKMTSAEKEFSKADGPTEAEAAPAEGAALSASQREDLAKWVKDQLGQKASRVRMTEKLGKAHPSVITLEEMAAAR